MIATIRSLLFLLASICLFQMATTYPHFGMDRVPLTRFPPALHNRTVEHSKRQPQGYIDLVNNYHDLKLSCGNDPEVCNNFAPPDLDKTSQPYPLPRPGEEVAPLNPPGGLECEPSPEPHVHFRDSHKVKVQIAAEDFCFYHARGRNGQEIAIKLSALPISATLISKTFLYPHTEKWTGGNHPKDDVYDLRVEWVENCKPDSRTGLNPIQPLNDAFCANIVQDAWKQCNNKGRGGSMVAGCFRYHIQPRF